MSALTYPEVSSYHIPKKNVLVLSCMDLRLTDNLVNFLNFENLQNRYDHFILAGTSLLTTKKQQALFQKGVLEKYAHWDKAIHDHIQLAIDLHHVKDVYIIEHEDCGAYANLLDQKKVDLSTQAKEHACHKKFAVELANAIHKQYKLHVHCFYIDLRGNVSLMYTKQ
jgi:carbonic anhydrase